MLALTFLLLTLNPLVARALPQEGRERCSVKTVTITEMVVLDPTTVIVTAERPPSSIPVPPSPTETVEVPTVKPITPSSSLVFSNRTEVVYSSSSSSSYPASSPPAASRNSTSTSTSTSTAAAVPPSSETGSSSAAIIIISSSTAESVAEKPQPTTNSAVRPTGVEAMPTAIAKPPSSANPSSGTQIVEEEAPSATTGSSSDPLADATVIEDSPEPTEMCGRSDRKIMPGFPWTVSNAMYNAEQMAGRQCTRYEDLVATPDGTQHVRYRSTTDIQRVGATEDVCKGYSNVGIGANLGRRFRDVEAIPASFRWERNNTAGFKGANVFDFITAPTPGDAASPATSEFMLWLAVWGGQVPIGHARGPVATFDLYGAAFDLYEGVNEASGVTVRSALPASSSSSSSSSSPAGEFAGDLRDWLQVMADRGYVRAGDYVNVGNAGTEVFYGSSEMEAAVALEIRVKA